MGQAVSRWVIAGGLAASFVGPAPGEEVITAPIIVFGPSRDARDLFETPNAVSVVGVTNTLRRQPSTYEDLIGDIPGVVIGGGPRGISQEPNIRGFTDEQIVLRFDGARQNFNLAHRGRFFTDPEILKRVEVVRGGASTLFGSGALGGVILADTKDAADFVEGDEVWGGRVKLGYNSQGDELLTAVTLAAQAGAFDALAFISYRPMFSDLEDGSGTAIRNSEIDAINGLVKFGWEPTEGTRLQAQYQIYDDDGETPPNANAASSPGTVVDRSLTYQSAQISLDWAPPGDTVLDLSVLLYGNLAEVEEDRISDGRLDQTDYTTLGFEVVNRSEFDLGLPIRLSYGVEGHRDAQEATRNGLARPQAPDASVLFLAAFVQADIDVAPELTITPGVRIDYYSLDPDGGFPDRTENEVSPRLAITWRPTDSLRLWASAAQSFRGPSLTELYNDGLHFDTGTSFGLGPGTVFTGLNEFIPTPDLKPEISRQIEVGARLRLQDVASQGDLVTLSGNAYFARVDDFIDTVVQFIDFDTATFNPFTGNLEVSGSTQSRNVDALLWGFELEAEYDSDVWFASVGASLARGSEVGGGALGSIPADRITLTIGGRPDPDVEIGFRTSLVDGQDDAPAGGITTPGYVLFDVFVNWTPSEGPLAGATFAAGIDNIADRTYRIHPNGLNQPGRAFKVSAAWEF